MKTQSTMKTTKTDLMKLDRFQLNIEMEPGDESLRYDIKGYAYAMRTTISRYCIEAIKDRMKRDRGRAQKSLFGTTPTSTRYRSLVQVQHRADLSQSGVSSALNGRDECSARGVGIAILRECGLSVQNNGVGEPP
jgi:hypothetical protein